MRYAQGGGYTPAEQQRRERLRLQAAGRFARGDTIREISRDLRDVVHPAAAIAAVRRIAARWSAARIIAAVLDRLTRWTPAAARRFRPPGGAGELPHGQQALDLGD